jgi:two-component system CitB family sensor kinase
VARLVARESGVIAGVKRADTVRLNALVERIRAEVGASYIVIGTGRHAAWRTPMRTGLANPWWG